MCIKYNIYIIVTFCPLDNFHHSPTDFFPPLQWIKKKKKIGAFLRGHFTFIHLLSSTTATTHEIVGVQVHF